MNVTSRILGETSKVSSEMTDYNPSKDAYLHAVVIKDRWPEGEKVIAMDPEFAFYYAEDFMSGRWPEAEPYIAKNPYWSYMYAKNIVKGRWPEGEHTMARDPEIVLRYATNVIKDRWPDAEETVANSLWREDYLQRFPDAKDDWILRGWVDWMDT